MNNKYRKIGIKVWISVCESEQNAGQVVSVTGWSGRCSSLVVFKAEESFDLSYLGVTPF